MRGGVPPPRQCLLPGPIVASARSKLEAIARLMRSSCGIAGITCGDTEVTLTGATFSGEAITGTDAIVIANCG
jgi:hypothetical protein